MSDNVAEVIAELSAAGVYMENRSPATPDCVCLRCRTVVALEYLRDEIASLSRALSEEHGRVARVRAIPAEFRYCAKLAVANRGAKAAFTACAESLDAALEDPAPTEKAVDA